MTGGLCSSLSHRLTWFSELSLGHFSHSGLREESWTEVMQIQEQKGEIILGFSQRVEGLSLQPHLGGIWRPFAS